MFPFYIQQITTVFKVGNNKELPPISDHLLEHCKDFIKKCLQCDPSHGATSVELLQHPFIQNGISFEKSVPPNPMEHMADILTTWILLFSFESSAQNCIYFSAFLLFLQLHASKIDMLVSLELLMLSICLSIVIKLCTSLWNFVFYYYFVGIKSN
jgi:serine/threonine protein kinase